MLFVLLFSSVYLRAPFAAYLIDSDSSFPIYVYDCIIWDNRRTHKGIPQNLTDL